MIKTSIENLAEPIAFDIANSDDNVQSALFNGLGKGFSTYRPDVLSMQLSYVVEKLTPAAEMVIEEMYEFIQLKRAR